MASLDFQGHLKKIRYNLLFGITLIEQSRVRYGDSMSPASNGWLLFRIFSGLIFEEFSQLRAYSPLTPRFYVLYPVVPGSGAAPFGRPPSAHFIGHGPATARAYSDILLVQYSDCMHLVIFPDSSQKFTAADQVPAYGDQPALVLVA